MSTAPAKRRAPKSDAANRSTARELIERRLESAAIEDSAREQMLTELCYDHTIEEINNGQLTFSRGQILVFEDMGIKSHHEIVRKLRSHYATLQLRAEVGCPGTLEAARERLKQCDRDEHTARAALEDVDDAGDDATPILARQIANLERKLKTLVTAREAAQREVASIEQRRKELHDRAPKWLKDQVAAEISAAKRCSRAYAELQRLTQVIHSKRIALERYTMETIVDDEKQVPCRFNEANPVFVAYARVYCPGLVREREWDGIINDEADFEEHLNFVRAVELPELEQEYARLQAEWEATKHEIASPIHLWMETGRFFE